MLQNDREMVHFVAVLVISSCCTIGGARAMELTDLNFSQRVDWSQAGYSDVIPTDRGKIINVRGLGVNGDGRRDVSGLLQKTINQADGPTILYFPAGTYRLTSRLDLRSNIILRGQGAEVTRIDCISSNGCIGVRGQVSGGDVDLRQSGVKGARQIVVADASGFTPGQGAQIQRTDIVTAEAGWGKGAVGQMFTIIEVTGNTLTVDPPLHLDYPLRGSPQIRPIHFMEQVGIEDLKVQRRDSGASSYSNISFRYTSNCWLQRVISDWTEKHHITASESLHLEFRDSYIHGAKSKGSGGYGYGVSLGKHATSILVENNIFSDLRHSMIIQVGANGCVFGYNYAEKNYSDDDGGWAKTYISLHGHYTYMNLFEGNIVAWIGIGDYWGPIGPGNTFFRNRVLGTNRFDGVGDRHGISVGYIHGPQNIIGNEVTGGSLYYYATRSHPEVVYENEWKKVVDHGNNVQGTISSAFADPSLPNSFYLKRRPDFYGAMAWPSLGGDKPLGSGTIPALERHRHGISVPEPTGPGGSVGNPWWLLFQEK